MRAILFGGGLALLISPLGTRVAINVLTEHGYGQEIRDDGPTTHHTKRGTPTMGGVVIILATVLGYFAAKLITLSPPSASGLLLLFLFVGCGLVGFLDDFIKIYKQRSLGLRSKAKMVGQTLVAVTFGALALSPSAHAGPAPPGAAHAYIARALKHTAPVVLGALRLLAASYADADALNRDGWALYAAFRPAVDGWGQRGEVRCATILGLRKQSGRAPGAGDAGMRKGLVEFEEASEKPGPGVDAPQAAEASGVKDEPDPTLSDDDALFDDTFTAEDLSHLP